MSPRYVLWLALPLALVLALAACGGQPSTKGPSAGAQPTVQTPTKSGATSAPAEQTQPTSAPKSPATASAATAAPTTAAAVVATSAPTTAPTEEAAAGAEDPEPDTLEQAAALQPGTTAGSLIEDDEDWFTISVPASGILTVAFTPDAGAEPMEVALSENGEDEVWHEYNVQPSVTKAVSQVLSVAEGMNYAITVLGGPGKYALDVTIESQDDAGSGADAGDTAASAPPLTAGKTYTGTVGDRDAEDLFKLAVPAGAVLGLSFATADDSGDKDVALLDADQDELWREYNVGAAAKSTSIILSHADGGTYYVRAGGEKGSYRFEVTADPQNDGGSGTDAGDKPASAVAVQLGKSYSGLIGDLDTYDLFAFEVKGGDIINVTFTPVVDAEPQSVTVMDMDMSEMWAEYNVGPSSAKTFTHVLDATAGGTYYVAVAEGKGGYTIDLSAVAQNDAGSGKDAGDKPASAVLIEPNATYTGQIGGSDADDLFKFEVEEGAIISVSFSPASDAKPIGIALWDPDLDELWAEYYVGPGVTKAYTYIVGSNLGGTYYVWVGAPEGQASYTFEVKVSGQDDAGSGGDAGDTPGTAVAVEAGVEFTGLLGNQDRDDYYRFEPEVGQRIIVTSGPDAEELDVSILDGDEYPLWEEYGLGPTKSVEYEIEEIEGETPYYLDIGGAGTYTAIIEPAP